MAKKKLTARQRKARKRAAYIRAEYYKNFDALEYLSSAGLRVLLASQKIMNKQGKMIIKNVNETINEIFEVTGFIDILTIE